MSSFVSHFFLWPACNLCCLFQEVIQNAEDAGATKVTFLIDHTTYGTDAELLYHPQLAKYQVLSHSCNILHIALFLADRTNGRAYATVLRLSSVCDVMYCG